MVEALEVWLEGHYDPYGGVGVVERGGGEDTDRGGGVVRGGGGDTDRGSVVAPEVWLEGHYDPYGGDAGGRVGHRIEDVAEVGDVVGRGGGGDADRGGGASRRRPRLDLM